jgi:hypothetical protein
MVYQTSRKRIMKQNTKITKKQHGGSGAVACVGDGKSQKSTTGPLQRSMNQALTAGNVAEMRKLIAENKELFATTCERGIITMLLRFAIQQNDDELISTIFHRLTMKRDFFDLMVYKHDVDYNINLFTTYIDSALLESKDIRFIIENNLLYLLNYLDGKFMYDSGGVKSTFDKSILCRYLLPDCAYYIAKIMAESIDQIMKMDPKIKAEKEANERLRMANQKMRPVVEEMRHLEYDVIIDGGNILHSRNGIPNPGDLESVLAIVRARRLRPIVIIHQSHTNIRNKKAASYAPRVNELLAGVQHLITPAHVNDDLFILLAYLIRIDGIQQSGYHPQPNGPTCHIITRDTYTDHMALFKKTEKNMSTDFGGHLAHNLISFTNVNGNIQIPVLKGYSGCIQVIGSVVYIPLSGANVGHFEEIQL